MSQTKAETKIESKLHQRGMLSFKIHYWFFFLTFILARDYFQAHSHRAYRRRYK